MKCAQGLRGATVLAIAAGFGLLGTPSAQADGSPTLTAGAGVFDVTDPHNNHNAAEGRLELRSGERFFADELGWRFGGIGPLIGVMATSDGAVWGYGALFLDLRLTERIVLWPSAGIGGYRQGDGRNLGGIFQFHLGALGAYRFDNGHLLGVSFNHISNANTQTLNPGADSLLLTYTVPLADLF